MTEELEKIKRSVRINRVLLLLVLVLFLFIIVGMCIGGAMISRILAMYKPTIDTLSKIDFAKISEQLSAVKFSEISEHMTKLESSLSKLATAFKDLKEVMEPISSLTVQSQE